MASPTLSADTVKGRSLTQDAVRRFFKNPTGILGLVIIVFFVLVSILAPFLRGNDPLKSNLRARQLPPTWTLTPEERLDEDVGLFTYPFGTDSQGRDILVRVMYGGRISLRAGLLAVALSVFIGVLLGVIAGYFGGWLDTLIVWAVDILLAFPGILLAIAFVSALGAGTLEFNIPLLPITLYLSNIEKALIAISITQIPIFTRITRSSVIGLRESEFVAAAKGLGANSPRIMFQHIFPNGLSPIMVQLTLSIGTAILDMAALGFLGLGAQPPTPEWGAMISDGFGRFRQAPWMSLFPGLGIFFSVIGFNLLGDAVRDVLDPRLKNA